MSQATEQLAKYGHHPDSEIDADVEIERLKGQLSEAHAAMNGALDLRVATPEGQAIKSNLRYWLEQHGFGPLGTRTRF